LNKRGVVKGVKKILLDELRKLQAERTLTKNGSAHPKKSGPAL